MLKKLLIGCFVISLIASCTSTSTQEDNSTEQQEESNSNQFGEAVSADRSMTYNELLTKLVENDSMDVKVQGTVSEVCQKKGCWMTIVSEDTDQEMRVRFKDYGFFVPKDISGRKVVFEGKAFRDITSVEDLKHYAEDGGKSKEEIDAITEPEEAYNFLASGVLLLDEKQ